MQTNYPQINAYGNSGFFAYFESSSVVTAFSGTISSYDNFYHLGVTSNSVSNGCTQATTSNFISPGNALLIDTKIDDGLPNVGLVQARGTGLNDFGANHAQAKYSIAMGATVTGNYNTLSSSYGCLTGPQSPLIQTVGYNTGMSISSQICQLRVSLY
jgi:hypothetical protein